MDRPAPGDCWQRGEANAVTLGRNYRIIRVPPLVPQPLAGLGLPPSCCARLLEAKAGGAPPGLESRAGFFFFFPPPPDKEWDPHYCPEPGQWKVTRTPKVGLKDGRLRCPLPAPTAETKEKTRSSDQFSNTQE
uniref:Uncharacterized protein n=1 Tax=Molossus molossus TaxID=27622 RepID=A0A7J8FZ90_MOLMO|nr:hypothetical protein HJG59_008247 [Molossus molossus]